MEFTGIQIAVSVIVIVGAAGVALLCDFLKGKNEQLREAMVELRVRREEEAIRIASATRNGSIVAAPVYAPQVIKTPVARTVAGHSAEAVAEQAAATVVAQAATVVAKAAANHAKTDARSSAPVARNSEDRTAGLVRKSTPRATQPPPASTPLVRAEATAAEIASVSGRRPAAPAPEVEAVPKKDDIGSDQALSDWLRRRAAARTAQTKQAAAVVEPTPTPVVAETVAEPVTPAPVAIEEPVETLAEAATAVPPVEVSSLPEVQIDAFLWESLSGETAVTKIAEPAPQQEQAAPAETQFQLIRGSSSTSNELLVPAGMHDEASLKHLLGINKPFTGLVVSIAVSENDGRALRNEDLLRSAALHVGTLLGDSDFGSRTAIDEFVMICPGVQGADAQRRLARIAERLWDYQLRGMGAFTTLFSWGGVDVANEPLSEAVSAATERMYQTKRSRKTVSMDTVSQRRKAV